jgi:hypothetical protein
MRRAAVQARHRTITKVLPSARLSLRIGYLRAIQDDGGDMSEKTILVVPGKKLSVPRPLKRSLQILAAVALTAGVALAILIGNGLLVPRGRLLQGWDTWLTFINRTDILATMVLTALVTVLFVYWQRDQERGK